MSPTADLASAVRIWAKRFVGRGKEVQSGQHVDQIDAAGDDADIVDDVKGVASMIGKGPAYVTGVTRVDESGLDPRNWACDVVGAIVSKINSRRGRGEPLT